MVCGHETLMKIIDYMRGRGVQPERFLFMPTNKTFGFGGDASRQADWSVRLPVYLSGKAGYMECFIVEGATPLLIGRPILQALKLQMNYDTNQMSLQDGPWTDVVLGKKGEFLIKLDDGVENDPTGSYVDFDFVTNETYAAISNYEDLENYIDVHEYLSTTNRTPPARDEHHRDRLPGRPCPGPHRDQATYHRQAGEVAPHALQQVFQAATSCDGTSSTCT